MGLIKESSFVLCPEGIFELTGKELKWNEKGKFGPQIEVKWETDEPMEDNEDENYSINDWVNPSISEKSRLLPLLKSMGAPVDSEDWKEELKSIEEPEELIDFLNPFFVSKKVTGVVKHVLAKNGEMKHTIESYVAIKPKRRKPAEAPAAPSEPEKPKRKRQDEESDRRAKTPPPPAEEDDFQDDDED